MPRAPQLEGDPDDLVPTQFKMPLWLKRAAVELAQSRGQDITELIKDLLRKETGATRPDPKKVKR